MSSIGIIDYGLGNIHSIAKALNLVAPKILVTITNDSSRLLKMDRLLLPGVGAISPCMEALQCNHLTTMIHRFVEKRPLMGICLGIAALGSFSEENGGVECIGVYPGRSVRFDFRAQALSGNKLKVPHIGWNQVCQTRKHHLWRQVPQHAWFYFVHSYYLNLNAGKHEIGISSHGHRFTAAVAAENVCAVQFHPEKSQAAGLQILENFLSWNGEP